MYSTVFTVSETQAQSDCISAAFYFKTKKPLQMTREERQVIFSALLFSRFQGILLEVHSAKWQQLMLREWQLLLDKQLFLRAEEMPNFHIMLRELKFFYKRKTKTVLIIIASYSNQKLCAEMDLFLNDEESSHWMVLNWGYNEAHRLAIKPYWSPAFASQKSLSKGSKSLNLFLVHAVWNGLSAAATVTD